MKAVPRIPEGRFPRLPLPICAPYPPMEGTSRNGLPSGPGWQFEPKWEGLRALAFRWRDVLVLQSKAGRPLDRFFPEVIRSLRAIPRQAFVLDGEIIVESGGCLVFDQIEARLLPGAQPGRLARSHPALYYAFDLLYAERLLVDRPLSERREVLEEFFEDVPEESRVRLSPKTRDRALAVKWLETLGEAGMEGVVAKRLDAPYRSGDRGAMVKVKRLKTIDCVVAGLRRGAVMLGLYDAKGTLHRVGELALVSNRRAWRAAREGTLVCEVRYDSFAQGRLRRGVEFVRWRPDQDPRSCRLDQVTPRKKIA